MGSTHTKANEANSLPERIRAYIANDYKDDQRSLEGAQFSYKTVDLNGDGKSEVIVYVSGPRVCGSSGCNTYILAPSGSAFREITVLATGFPPVRVLGSRSHGWSDLSVRVMGGGREKPYNVKLQFNGSTYPEDPEDGTRIPDQVANAGALLISDHAKGSPVMLPHRGK